ncbi:MAG TPA: CHAT domain-containing protein, partial [Myxococcaceae bacterium]
TASSPSLILQLDAELESKPWELMEVLGKPLALQAAVSRTPVGLTSAARGRPMFREPVRALLIGDPTGNLPVARAEVEEIAKLYHKPIVLIGDDANAEDVGEVTLRGCDVIHFAGSAWCDSQDMYLVLAGGTHLTDDLIRPGLSHRPPCVVMLNSHYTAFVPPGVGWKGPDPMKATSGGRMGFTEVMMRAGVGVFVGCFGAPSDTGGAAVALAFHRALLTGVSAAEALRRARNAPTVPKDDPTPLLYSLSGYGDLALE